ncbi:MAG: hypothetical protein CVU65_15010 [Deltaproteobacteria bacterium HGW-Deltaproteobacteria-22]|nr:MAG: hypothetical protein CVU65_15010 [Deltaproteobacteria bacterium HGW-Deltaproteobacteria-22]
MAALPSPGLHDFQTLQLARGQQRPDFLVDLLMDGPNPGRGLLEDGVELGTVLFIDGLNRLLLTGIEPQSRVVVGTAEGLRAWCVD